MNESTFKSTSKDMYATGFIFLFLVHFSTTTSDCRCDKRSCNTPKNCTHGLVWDRCYCCLVCGKGEGELCGGKNYTQGECGGSWQQCVVRDSKNYLNRFKDKAAELVGRCEPYSCAFEQCLVGQWCTIKDGYTHCHCNIDCSGMIDEPVCGETNNKRYENECQLRREECAIGRRIGISITPCPGSNIAKVTCSSSRMELTLDRKILGRRRPRGLVLNDTSCKAVVNRTHIRVSTLYGGCGTKSKYTLSSIIYSNTLKTLRPINSFIFRGKQVSIPFKCEFSLRSRNRNRVKYSLVSPPVSESTQPGKYTTQLSDGSYAEIDTNRNYTVVLTTSRYKGLSVKLMPMHCHGTPFERGYTNRRLILIDKGCPTQKNVVVKSSTDSKIYLQIPGMRFKQMRKSAVNIRCKVRPCFLRTAVRNVICQPQCELKTRNERFRKSVQTEGMNYKNLKVFYGRRSRPLHRKPIIIQPPKPN